MLSYLKTSGMTRNSHGIKDAEKWLSPVYNVDKLSLRMNRTTQLHRPMLAYVKGFRLHTGNLPRITVDSLTYDDGVMELSKNMAEASRKT